MNLAQALVLPLLLHVLMTLAIGVMTLRSRIASVRSGKVQLSAVAVDNGHWPEESRMLANNFDNQFQVPLFAYAAGALLVATGMADLAGVALMWLFLAGRVLHSIEHTGRNNIRRRLGWFLVSYLSVVALWLWFALRFLVMG